MLTVFLITSIMPTSIFAQTANDVSEIVTAQESKITYGPYKGIDENKKHAYEPFKEKEDKLDLEETKNFNYRKDRVLIKMDTSGYKSQSDSNSFESEGIVSLEPIFNVEKTETFRAQAEDENKQNLTKWYRANLKEGTDVIEAIETLRDESRVLAVEPDYLRNLESVGIPNPSSNPEMFEQWYLERAHVKDAWKYLEEEGINPGGSRDVVVAVIDTGVDYDHPDLTGNMWTNTGEIPDNGIDDDGNGFVDDIHGATTVGNKYAGESGDPMDDHGHGTHVAGIIAASGNNGVGGVGIAYNTQIMAIKAAQSGGILSASDIAEAIYYAAEKGADVINMSFGGYGRSIVEEDALQVAFGTSVLISSAGNDGKPNLPHPYGVDSFPAAYPWVLGVMAESEYPAPNGDNLASFSNWDWKAQDSHEYEVMAPGVDIYSTLPNERYAKWDGTSMAAPVVSGIAALLRSKFTDKDSYSSRFIMGQLASTGDVKQGITYSQKKPPLFYKEVNAYKALTDTPKPKLSYIEHYIFDKADIAEGNDGDGVVDAGETIDLAMIIRNHWGKAENVEVTLDTIGSGGMSDPYVTFITDTVNYGAVGNFAIDDNGLIYENDVVVGVNSPFKIKVADNTPNDHMIPINITLTAKNGYDANDENTYTFKDSINIMVRRGRELPSVIKENMTLTKDEYWIIPNATLIEKGVTVTVEPGTQIQFWSSDTANPYATEQVAYLQVEGELIVNGTAEEPVEMFPSTLYPRREIRIQATYELEISGTRCYLGGAADLNYAKIINPSLAVNNIDHCYLSQNIMGAIHKWWIYNDELYTYYGPYIKADLIKNSIFYKLGYDNPYSKEHDLLNIDGELKGNLFDSCAYFMDSTKAQENVFLKNYIKNNNEYWTSEANINSKIQDDFKNNAILNTWHDLDIEHWMLFNSAGDREEINYLTHNYWGTTSEDLVEIAIVDYHDDFNRAEVMYEPILTEAPETAYPFVTDVYVSTETEERANRVGAESVSVHVYFNRDMDIDIQPQVSFGPDMPYTDFNVNGDWVDSRHWLGEMNITPTTGDGYQYFRVAKAVAADDPWLVTGNDSERFRFEIITSGTEAMNLQATGTEGQVELSWSQDDFDLLAGYNIYRSETLDGAYTNRINTSVIPSDTKKYIDTDVEPGKTYYYKFKVVKTDLTESDFSNVAAGTPFDTIPPVISHEPVQSAAVGLPLQIYADVTDNVMVDKVKLYYKNSEDTEYSVKEMVKTTNNRYSATLEGSLVQPPGLDYYLEASDGLTKIKDGRPDMPRKIVITDAPKITSISPSKGSESGGTSIIITGANFKEGASVTFDGAVASEVVVESDSRITATTPAHYPATVDVAITNPDGYKNTLLRAFTYMSEGVEISVPNVSANKGNIIEVPIIVSEITGLRSLDVKLTYDKDVLGVVDVRKGMLTSNFSLTPNTTIPGKLTIAMASATGASGSGKIAYIEFKVLDGEKTSSPLNLEEVTINSPGSVIVTTTNGTFSFSDTYEIKGNIRYYKNSRNISGVNMELEGQKTYTASTDINGQYILSGIESSDYKLIPGKEDEATDISSYDASLILQHSAGLITLSEHQKKAADVNNDGVITAMDAAYVLEKAVDLLQLPFPGAGKVWTFTPEEKTYTNLNSNKNYENFTGILIGDVSGNWKESNETMIQSMQSEDALKVGIVRTKPGGAVSVPIMYNANNLYGADITINYDENLLTNVSIELSEEAEDFVPVVNSLVPGKIVIGLAGSTAISGEGELLTIKFDAVDNSGNEVTLNINKANINEKTNIETENGKVIISIKGDVDLNNVVDIVDLTKAAMSYGKKDREVDMNGDGLIDIYDLVTIVKEMK